MKLLTKITALLSFGLFLLYAAPGHAQMENIIPRSDLIKSLDDVSDLGFSNDKTDMLFEQNENFVDSLFDIMDGDQSEEDKKLALKNLKKENENSLLSLLGEDGLKQYKKKMKKVLKPYKRKMNLLKLAL